MVFGLFIKRYFACTLNFKTLTIYTHTPALLKASITFCINSIRDKTIQHSIRNIIQLRLFVITLTFT